MAPIAPLSQPALADLRNALQVAAIFGEKDIADSEAKQALGRIRGLIARAIAKLGEPNKAALHAAELWLLNGKEREVRDCAAAILYAAITGEVGGESWIDGLPCPGCGGVGMIGSIPCDQCKGAGKL